MKTGIRGMRMIQKRKAVYKTWMFVFCGGLFFGILLLGGLKELLVNENGIFGPAFLRYLQNPKIEQNAFLAYVIRQRMKEYIMLGILSTTFLGISSVYFFIVWQGMISGMVLATVFVRFGLKGIILLVAGMFPHQLLFIPATVMMLIWTYQNCSFFYYPGKYIGPGYHHKKQIFVRQGFLLVWIFCVVFIGCILECYVNPILLTDVAKIFYLS